LLFHLARGSQPRQTLTELCEGVGIYKSKGYSLLNTLAEFGLVTRDPGTKAYGLGPGVLVLSRAFLDHTDLGGAAAPFLDDLAQQTGATALLGLVSGDRVVVVAKREAPERLGITIRVGHRYPLTWGAHGKAIVAFLPEGERARLLAGGPLYFRGDAAAPDPEALDAELELARRSGYAADLGGVQAGIHAAAAPVFGAAGRVIGCLVAVGTFPAGEAPGVGERVAAAARQVSEFLGPTIERLHREG
ncbi:MAG: IclR family transcriptional regulator, partial [Deferrisomatales bacterium]